MWFKFRSSTTVLETFLTTLNPATSLAVFTLADPSVVSVSSLISVASAGTGGAYCQGWNFSANVTYYIQVVNSNAAGSFQLLVAPGAFPVRVRLVVLSCSRCWVVVISLAPTDGTVVVCSPVPPPTDPCTGE